MELIGATIRQYWLLYGTQEIHRAWKQSLQIAESFLEDVERRAGEGKIPETNLMEARCSIGLWRAEVYNAENRLIEAQSQLMTLLYVSAVGSMMPRKVPGRSCGNPENRPISIPCKEMGFIILSQADAGFSWIHVMEEVAHSTILKYNAPK